MKCSTHEGLDYYAKHRVPTGGFLHAVLSNDLMAAIVKADEDNIQDIYEIVIYIINNLPIKSYGSPENVKAWLAGRDKV